MVGRLQVILSLFALAGCSSIPDVPDQYEMPVQDILTHSVCELKTAFERLQRIKNFHSSEWAVAISLTPRVDTDAQFNIGALGKSTANTKATNYITWVLGSPGGQFDYKGHRDGSVSFLVHSRDLLDGKHLIDCTPPSSPNALLQKLGIEEWLARLIVTDKAGIDRLTHLDKPTYNSEIIVKLGLGAGGPSFVGPYATVSPTVLGSHTSDITLSIAMTPDSEKKTAGSATLPEGAIRKNFGQVAGPSISAAARERLDTIQTDSILRNLHIQLE